jgi:MFS family permease
MDDQAINRSSERLFMTGWILMVLPVVTGVLTFVVWMLIGGRWLDQAAVINVLFYLLCLVTALTCMVVYAPRALRDGISATALWLRAIAFAAAVAMGPITAGVLATLMAVWGWNVETYRGCF